MSRAAVNQIRDSLALCPALHTVELRLGPGGYTAAGAAVTLAWLTSLRHLKHLMLSLYSSEAGIPHLPWVQLLETCRASPTLHSVALSARVRGEDTDVSAYDGQDEPIRLEIEKWREEGTLFFGNDPGCNECTYKA